ncbi:unnamed protein product [Mycena citricolor]|uniref:Aminoglycoside phosphotransferase domain-containing protein n=1 Tax=Mycena citricolor TaxID=2018698 RepID=A0AAD2HFY5_9AGAR|nr:unnamed protein product [Mycena citricolor]
MFNTSTMAPPTITIEQAQAVVDKHLSSESDTPATIVNFIKVSHGFSYNPLLTTYLLDLAISTNAEPTHSTFLVVSNADEDQASEVYKPNSLALFPQIISVIRQNTTIPIPEPKFSDPDDILPYMYLTTPIYPLVSSRLISLADARAGRALNAKQQAYIDLQLGKYLGELHNGAMNDFFGLPSATPPSNPSYEWQETFTSLLESLLDASAAGIEEPVLAQLRTALARAISAFLFADVEVPSLIWFTGSADDVFLAFAASGELNAFAILPSVAHALWGDPLLETFFLDASDAFWEAYRATRGADGNLIVFPRQRTKRVWYDVFLALVVLREHRDSDGEKNVWARERLKQSAAKLVDAPCY